MVYEIRLKDMKGQEMGRLATDMDDMAEEVVLSLLRKMKEASFKIEVIEVSELSYQW